MLDVAWVGRGEGKREKELWGSSVSRSWQGEREVLQSEVRGEKQMGQKEERGSQRGKESEDEEAQRVWQCLQGAGHLDLERGQHFPCWLGSHSALRSSAGSLAALL